LTTAGKHRPLVGPVLQTAYDTIQQSSLVVSPNGSALLVSTGTPTIAVVDVQAGSALTVSSGSVTVVLIPPVTGSELSVLLGSVTIIAGDSITVGVSGATLTTASGTVSIAGEIFAFGTPLDVISGSLLTAGVAVPVTERVVTVGGPPLPESILMDVLQEQLGQQANSGTIRRHSRLRSGS